MPLILHIFLILVATAFALGAAVKRDQKPDQALAFGWFALFWFLLDVLITAICSWK